MTSMIRLRIKTDRVSGEKPPHHSGYQRDSLEATQSFSCFCHESSLNGTTLGICFQAKDERQGC
jgi:hypothetical protein